MFGIFTTEPQLNTYRGLQSFAAARVRGSSSALQARRSARAGEPEGGPEPHIPGHHSVRKLQGRLPSPSIDNLVNQAGPIC